MGLKLKKFRAKLKARSKNVTEEVVCLKYQIHSEFQDPVETAQIATTSIPKTVVRTTEVIKQKKLAPKPSVQNVFNNTLTPEANSSLQADENYTAASTNAHAQQPKGILKKADLCFPQEDSVTKYSVQDEDEKKSVLIFMTENHDDVEDKTIANKKVYKNDTSHYTTNAAQNVNANVKNGTTMNHQEVELRIKNTLNERRKPRVIHNDCEEAKKTEKSIDDGSESADSKIVRWRETVIEIKPNIKCDMSDPEHNKESNSIDDFKVHYAKQGLSSDKQQLDDSECTSEEDAEEADNSHYRSRGPYTSQAASIFFQGAEPAPTLRIRSHSNQDEENSQSMA